MNHRLKTIQFRVVKTEKDKSTNKLTAFRLIVLNEKNIYKYDKT